MSLDFDTRFPRFSIGPNDRVTIKGRAFRLVQRMSDAFVLIPADGEGLAETFPFALLNALSAKGKVRHEVDYYLPAFQRAPAFALAACVPVGDLPAAVKARLDVRNALVEGFKKLYRAGLVKKTSRSVDAMEEQILDAARSYLDQQADTEKMEREALARKGAGRGLRGGVVERTIRAVDPRTLLE